MYYTWFYWKKYSEDKMIFIRLSLKLFYFKLYHHLVSSIYKRYHNEIVTRSCTRKEKRIVPVKRQKFERREKIRSIEGQIGPTRRELLLYSVQ